MNRFFLLVTLSILTIMIIGVYEKSYAQSLVPEWVKNTAKWYGEDKIMEQEFLDMIKYLVQNDIINLDEPKNSAALIPDPDVSVITPKITQCNILYLAFKGLDEGHFRSNYSHVNYLNTCIKLYKDPIWNYNGPDRLEKLAQKFQEESQKIAIPEEILSKQPHGKILSITNIGTEKFLVDFDICAGDNTLDKAKAVVQSDIESIQVGTEKDVPANECRTYETQIHSKYADEIKIDILEQVLK